MMLQRQKITRQYQTFQESGKRHLYNRPYLIPIFGIILGAIIVAAAILTNGNQVLYRPDSSHVFFLFDNGHQETLDTKAATVGELVNKLPLHLISQDVVEPSRDTPIFDDNFRINIYRARPVTVVDGAKKTVTLTAQMSARQVAENAGLKLTAEDVANFSQGNLSQNIIGEQVVVSRAVPIQLNL